ASVLSPSRRVKCGECSKEWKAAGPDGICGRVLKACADQLSPVFTDIFNLSLTLGIVPSGFKRSTIVPSRKNLDLPATTTTTLLPSHRWATVSHPPSPSALELLRVLSPLLNSLYTYDCVATSSFTTIVKSADDTVIMGLISDNLEKTPGELDLSWSPHTKSLAKKARQRLYHLRRLRDFRLPSKVLRNFYTCTIESILTGNITAWFGNSTEQDRQALQRVVCLAECIIHMELPDLQTIHHKRCQTKARGIVRDPTHPSNRLFSLL
ncbi:hypothetical protein P4O66_012059, partial [Electrophorus voltai]